MVQEYRVCGIATSFFVKYNPMVSKALRRLFPGCTRAHPKGQAPFCQRPISFVERPIERHGFLPETIFVKTADLGAALAPLGISDTLAQ